MKEGTKLLRKNICVNSIVNYDNVKLKGKPTKKKLPYLVFPVAVLCTLKWNNSIRRVVLQLSHYPHPSPPPLRVRLKEK